VLDWSWSLLMLMLQVPRSALLRSEFGRYAVHCFGTAPDRSRDHVPFRSPRVFVCSDFSETVLPLACRSFATATFSVPVQLRFRHHALFFSSGTTDGGIRNQWCDHGAHGIGIQLSTASGPFSAWSVPVFIHLYHGTPQHTTKHANHPSPLERGSYAHNPG